MRFAAIRVRIDPQVESSIAVASPRDDEPAGACLERDTWRSFDLGQHDGSCVIGIDALPGTARANSGWALKLDGTPTPFGLSQARARESDAVALLVRSPCPRVVAVRGAREALANAPCESGGVHRIWSAPFRPSWTELRDTPAIVVGPTNDLGHEIVAGTWTLATVLGRFRPGLVPSPAVSGDSLVLTDRLRFPAVALPPASRARSVTVTLTHAHLPAGALLEIVVAGEPVASLDPADDFSGSWSSPAIEISTDAESGEVELVLRGADAGSEAHVKSVVFWAGR